MPYLAESVKHALAREQHPIGALASVLGPRGARRLRERRPSLDDHLNWRLAGVARAAVADLILLDEPSLRRFIAGDLFPDSLREIL